MKFDTDLSGTPLKGTLRYNTSEHAFEFLPLTPTDLAARTGAAGTTSIALGTLQLELDVSTGLVLFAWGYSPRTAWRDGSLPNPQMKSGAVRVIATSAFKPGVAVDFTEARDWQLTRDQTSQWVFLGCSPEPSSVVEIATGVGLVIRNAVLSGVWLRPTVKT